MSRRPFPNLPFLTLTFLLLLLQLATPTTSKKVTNPNTPPRNAILLSKVSSLTLRSNRQTTHRRVPSVPQLTCTGPPQICTLYTIDTMRCTNEGADYEKEDIQWACRADLPEEFKLGGTEVVCEGYESAEDPYVLKGSCGVEYRLVLTEKGEERFGRVGGGGPSWGGDDHESSLFVKVAVLAVFGVVVFIIISGFLRAWRGGPPRLGGDGGRQPPWFGGGGGGGGDDSDDPPPPYDSDGYGGQSKKSRSAGARTGSGGSTRGSGGGRQQQQQGWRPGPWTAGLAGAGLGYALGRGQNRTQPQPRQNSRQGGFFGNGGGPSSPSTSPPTFSGSTHSSTGFGGTSRR